MFASHKEHYSALLDHLLLPAHVSMWTSSILQNWPASRLSYPESWLSFLAAQGSDHLQIFQEEVPLPGMPEDLVRLVSYVQTLCELPGVFEEWSLSISDRQGLSAKKQHEIQRLLPMLATEAATVQCAVDIGGGKGHLARLCIKYFGWPFTTVDRDAALQTKGQWWMKRNRDLLSENLTFLEADLKDEPRPQVDQLFARRDTLSLGLHTCGGLALTQLRKSLTADVLVNFGCCYDKVEVNSARAKDQLNLSAVAKSRPLPWSQHALFLATRSRKGMTRAEFLLLKRVYQQRFTLALLLKELVPEVKFIVAGDAPKTLYNQSFAVYAANRLAALGLPLPGDELWLQSYAEREEIHTEVALIFAAHQIRNLFARALEVALLLDRALWLEEQDCTVQLIQTFDRKLTEIECFSTPRPSLG